MVRTRTRRKGSKRLKRSGRQSDTWTLGGFSVRAILFAVAILLALSYLSVVINPAKAWFFSIFGLLFDLLLLIDIVLLIWAVKHRSRISILAFLVLVPAFFFLGEQIQLPSKGRPVAASEGDCTMKVVSYNVGRFRQSNDKNFTGSWRDCADSIRTFLMEQDADIICLQEVYIPAAANVDRWLNRWMKGYNAEYFFYGSDGKYGNVTLSRAEAVDRGVIRFENSRNLALYTDYDSEDGVFRVYNCHFESYNISVSGVLQGLLNWGKNSKAGQEVIKDAASKVKRGITQRPKQVNQVFDHILSSPVEAMVCGDFNDTPMSYTYRKLSRRRGDTFCEAGEGFGATFAPFWPLIRIDYVLFPEMFSALSHVTVRKPFSDHYPVVATLQLGQ